MRLRETLVAVAGLWASSVALAAGPSGIGSVTVDERAVRVRLFDDRSVVTLPAAYAGRTKLPVSVRPASS